MLKLNLKPPRQTPRFKIRYNPYFNHPCDLTDEEHMFIDMVTGRGQEEAKEEDEEAIRKKVREQLRKKMLKQMLEQKEES